MGRRSKEQENPKDDVLRAPVREAVKSALMNTGCSNSIDVDIFTACFGKEWIKNFLCSGTVTMQTLENFLEDKIPETETIMNRLRTTQHNINLYNRLSGLKLPIVFLKGYNKVVHDKMSPDVEVYMYENMELFREYGKGYKKVPFETGTHLFINYAGKMLPRDYVERVKLAVEKSREEGTNAHVHLFVPEDIIITKKYAKEIYDCGADIIKSDYSRASMEKYIHKLKSSYIAKKAGKSTGFINLQERNRELAKLPLHTLVSDQLGTFDPIEIESFIYALGEERIRQCVSGGMPLTQYHRFLYGDKSNFNELIGVEFNVFNRERFENMGIKNVKYEVGKENTSADLICDLSGKESFSAVITQNSVKSTNYQPGEHVFEAKANAVLRSDVIEQAGRLKYLYPNVHVITLYGSRINDEVLKELSNIGVDVIVAPITKSGLGRRLDNIKEIFENSKALKIKEISEVKTKFREKFEKDCFKIDDEQLDKFVNILGEFNIAQLINLKLNIRNIYEYLNGIQQFPAIKTFASQYFSHIEANNCARKELKNAGFDVVYSVQNRQEFDGKRINLVANSVNSASDLEVVKLLENGEAKKISLKDDSGEHLFIVNHLECIEEHILNEAKLAASKKYHVHVGIFNGTKLNKNIIKKIYESGADIISFDTSRQQIRKNISDIKNTIKTFFKKEM